MAATAVHAPSGLPRLITDATGTESLQAHTRRLGAMPEISAGRRHTTDLIEVVDRSGLRGRGGSGFPTATKMRAVANGRGRRVVVANGSEGEPASRKDAFLLTTRPHLVLDGASLAARAVGASDVIIAVDRSNDHARATVDHAIAERYAARVDPVRIRVVDVPSRYVAGEESALVHLINGGDAKPTFVPPRPFERGVQGRATLIQNVETLAHLALIARFGSEWFREVGTPAEPGSAMVTLGGAVVRPGVYEIAIGTSIRDVVAAAGGESGDVAAFLTGGYFGTWIPAPVAWDLSLGHLELRRAGAAFGCGVLYALPTGACGLAETARVARYLADESAGQCGPCVHGLSAIVGALDSVVEGRQVEHMTGLIRRWTSQIAGRGACHLPDGAIAFVASALDTFSPDLQRHHSRGSCSSAHRPGLLPLPTAKDRDWGWR
ncbi:MAG: NADH-ubiquinone oxidoreductase-F iron-sulfur binding region domain-containing protein [Acidimicrobiia bacterium]